MSDDLSKIIDEGLANGSNLSNKIDRIIDEVCRSNAYLSLMRHRDRYDRLQMRITTQIHSLAMAIDSMGSLVPIEFVSKDCQTIMTNKNEDGFSFDDSFMGLNEIIKKNALGIIDQTDNDFKADIMRRVLIVRGYQECRLLDSARVQVENEKTGIFGRRKKQEEKDIKLEEIDASKRKIKAFIKNVQKFGIDMTQNYSARDIMGEIKFAEQGPLNEQEKRELDEVSFLLNTIFEIDSDGINIRLQKNSQEYSEQDRSAKFLQRYEGLAHTSKNNRPEHPAVRFVKDLKRQLTSVKNRSKLDYEDLIEERDTSSRDETLEGR